MRNTALLGALIGLVVTVGRVNGDSWARAVEQLYFSSNKKYVAQVTPAKKDSPAHVVVYVVRDNQGWISWQCDLGNEGAPQEVFISDDGKHVVTVNENSERVHGGMGDHVLAFYDRNGRVRNYSLEQILHFPDQIDEKQFRELAQRSVSGRSWTSYPMFIEQDGDQMYFCTWLSHGRRWLAWDVPTGREIELTRERIDRWNEKGRAWALVAAESAQSWAQAISYLAQLKRPEDRRIIEQFLGGDDFHTWYRHKNEEFSYYYAYSTRRDIAEQILAQWDGRTWREPGQAIPNYHHLGFVEGAIELDRAPKPDTGWLCIYLLPTSGHPEPWHSTVPVHRLTVHFSRFHMSRSRWPGKEIAFAFQGVTPGRYYAKAVWDRTEPVTFGDDYIKGPPSPGDVENIQLPEITVEAGQAVKDVRIHCTNAVKAPTTND